MRSSEIRTSMFTPTMTPMKHGTRAAWSLAIFLGLLASAGASLARAQDPFGGPAAAGGDPFGGPRPAAAGADPFGAQQPALPGGPLPGALGGPAPRPQQETDPVVLAIRESNPRTPTERMRAVQAMLDYGRMDEAQRYLQAILSDQPDVNALARLAREFGSALFLRLAREEQVQPEGEQLADAVLEASARVTRDPQRLRGLVRQLNSPSPEQRTAALNDLRTAGLAAVNPLLEPLRDPARVAERERVRAALVELGPAFADPLLGALEAEQDEFRAEVLDVLGQLKARQAVPYLVQPAIDEDNPPALRESARRALRRTVGAVPALWEAERYLLGRIRESLTPSDAPENAGTAVIWSWDAERGEVVPRTVGVGQAGALTAARLAEDLFQLRPGNPEFLRLFLVAGLENAKRMHGFGRPLPGGDSSMRAQAAAQGPAAVEEALVWAMQERYIGAAIGAAEVLAQIGDASLLAGDGLTESPLARALRHRNRRVRFAAAMAILELDPQRPYPGSSFLVETLGWLAATTGERRALVVHPRAEFTQSLVGLLAQIGYEADSEQTGRRAILTAAREGDLEFALISPFVDGPPFQELVQRLRRNPPTATLPVGIMARPDQMQEAADFAADDPLTRAFPRPHDPATLSFQAAELLSLSAVDHVPLDERLQQASAAIDGLLRLASEPRKYGFYDLLRQEANVISALNRAPLGRRAAALLGIFGTPEAQRTLVDLASQQARPLALRQAAVEAFRQAVERRGLLLTTDRILLQYDRYNQSATLDAETQQVLGELLDVMESRARQARTASATGRGDGPSD